MIQKKENDNGGKNSLTHYVEIEKHSKYFTMSYF